MSILSTKGRAVDAFAGAVDDIVEHSDLVFGDNRLVHGNCLRRRLFLAATAHQHDRRQHAKCDDDD